MSKVIFQIGHLQINIFGLMIVIGILAGLWLAVREAKKTGVDPDSIMELVLYTVIGGVVGARLIYVLVYNPQYYMAEPLAILKIYEGGLSIHGGLLGGILVGGLYVKKKGLSFWKTADLVTPSLILGQAIGRIGCDVFGKPILGSLPWGVSINGQLLHPAQAYEFLLNYLLFFVLWRKRKNLEYNGQLFTTYLWAYPVIRAFVEIFRTNPQIFGISVSYIISLVFVIAAILLKRYLKQTMPLAKNNNKESRKSFLFDLGSVLVAIVISLVIYYSLY